MKDAISAEDSALASPVGSRFGNCPYYGIVGLGTSEQEAGRNPGLPGKRGPGGEAVVFVITRDVKVVQEV